MREDTGRLEVALARIDAGLWKVDVERGLLYGGRYAGSGYSAVRAGRAAKRRPWKPIGHRDSAGYLVVSVWLPEAERETPVLVHRVLWAAAHRKADFPQLNHRNGNKADNRLENLEESSPPANLAHAAQLGLVAQGARHWSAKVTEADVRAIRALWETRRFTAKAIGAVFGLSHTAAWEIATRRRWRHVT